MNATRLASQRKLVVLCKCRTIAERMDPGLRQAWDKSAAKIVKAAKAKIPAAFPGVSDQQRALGSMVENTCVTSATITADYQSGQHNDRGDNNEHPLMAGTAWFAKGTISSSESLLTNDTIAHQLISHACKL